MDWKATGFSAPPTGDSDYRKRRAARLPVYETTSLKKQNLYMVEVKVHDLSSCGFMAECADPVGIGSFIALDVPGIGAVQAQVRWQLGNRMGGMFLDPISLGECQWTAERAAEQI